MLIISNPMSILKPVLRKELAKFIRDKFPVAKKRSAFWFFTNEFKNNLIETSNVLQQTQATAIKISNNDTQNRPSPSSSKVVVKVSRNRVLQMWRNMDPESKRKYFNMAEFDDLRYEEQKSLWVSEVGALLHEHKDINRVKDLAPTFEELQEEFLESLDKLHKNYEQMIQTESTKMLYRHTIKQVDMSRPSLETSDLISALPIHHKPILSKPRRPPTSYALFATDNRARFVQMSRGQRVPRASYLQLAAREWTSMSKEAKQVFEERYVKLKEEYDKAMEQYKLGLSQGSDDYLEMASREKKLFRRSLRRRLRESSVLPLSIRNPFNFFVMEQKDSQMSGLLKTWRSMTPEEKEIYVKMNEMDVIRYKREIEAYNEIKKSLSEMVGGGGGGSRKKKISELDGDDESESQDENSSSSSSSPPPSEQENIK